MALLPLPTNAPFLSVRLPAADDNERGQRPVVLKLLKSEYPSPRDLARLWHEYRLIRSLNCVGMVHAYGLETLGNSLPLVLQDIGGQSLHELLRTGPLSLSESLHIAILLADAVAHAASASSRLA